MKILKRIKPWIEFILFLVYTYFFYLLAKVSEKGGFSRYKVLFIILFSILILGIFLLFILRERKIDNLSKKTSNSIGKIKFLAFFLVTIIFSAKIIHSAIPYNGVLSWEIDRWLNNKSIPYAHNNIYEDGIDGMFDDISQKLDLPEEPYMSDYFSIKTDQEGKIYNVYTLLYGKDKDNNHKSFLINYVGKKQNNLNVTINAYAKPEYNEEKLLAPMNDILSSPIFQSEMKKNLDAEGFSLVYSGKKEYNSSYNLVLIDSNKNPDYNKSSEKELEKLQSGGKIKAYSLTLNNEKTFIIYPEHVEDIPVEEESIPEEVIENLKYEDVIWYTEPETGTVFHINKYNKSYKLVITDAALGSYFYKLYYSDNNGINWKELNDNPFNDDAGVAEGLEFIDENLGFISMGGASGEFSSIYITTDGGKNFSEIKLPMEQVKKSPNPDIPLDKYKYLTMPIIENDLMKIVVKSHRDDKEGIIFVSKDKGKTWNLLEEWETI